MLSRWGFPLSDIRDVPLLAGNMAFSLLQRTGPWHAFLHFRHLNAYFSRVPLFLAFHPPVSASSLSSFAISASSTCSCHEPHHPLYPPLLSSDPTLFKTHHTLTTGTSHYNHGSCNTHLFTSIFNFPISGNTHSQYSFPTPTSRPMISLFYVHRFDPTPTPTTSLTRLTTFSNLVPSTHHPPTYLLGLFSLISPFLTSLPTSLIGFSSIPYLVPHFMPVSVSRLPSLFLYFPSAL